MSTVDLLPKKNLNAAVIAVALIAIIVVATSFYCLGNAGATPTMSSLAGTYSSSTTGYTIVLYTNGSALFSSHSGTWSIVNETTFAGNYAILNAPRTDYFTITNNGFTAVGTGNEYVKTASTSPSPTESPTQSTTSTPAASASPNPSVPEFSNASLALIVTMIAIATCTVALAATKRKKPI